jgi:hypothetical protein
LAPFLTSGNTSREEFSIKEGATLTADEWLAAQPKELFLDVLNKLTASVV